MLLETPEMRLLYIKQRQAELMSAAASDRPVPSRQRRQGRNAGFIGLRIRLGSLLIAIGRTLCDEDALRRDAAHS